MTKTDELFENVRQGIILLKAERDNLASNLRDCRNELCLYCRKYKMAHNGACDGCRWKDGAWNG